MTRTRRTTGAALILLSGLLASASLQAERPRPVTQRAMETCDAQLAKDWSVCDGSADAATRRKCDESAQVKWQRCYEKAGWVISAQGRPKLPVRRPAAVAVKNTGGASVVAGRNQTTAVQTRPAPAATPKKSAWVVPGARQTGSHMR